MPLVHNLKSLELVRSVLVPEHGTVTADCTFACVAVVVHWGVVMHLTYFLCLGLLCLEGIDGSCDLLNETAVHQLVDSQRCPTVRALLPLLY